MDAAPNRREGENVIKIRQALDDKKLVIIVGAGVSLDAIQPPPLRITWIGLIRDGLNYLEEERFVAGDDKELTHYRNVLNGGNLNVRTVLRACGYLKDELDHNKQFPTWLHSVFGSLHHEVNRPGIFEALRGFHGRGARLMTTNYDELLEHYCGLQRVRRLIPEDVRKYEQRTLDGVFHIHGSFQDPQEVVLDPIGYYQVKTSDDVQNLLKTYLGHNTILFVGCGSGLEDPNFRALLEWASSREETIPNHHYLLARDRDNLRYNPLITLRYGSDYEDLVPYLNTLLGGPANALAVDTSARRMTSAETGSDSHVNRKLKNKHWCVPQSVNTLFTGRTEVLERIETAITSRENERTQRRFIITGMGGQGKSEICLRIADRVREAFWGVFWVDVSSESAAAADFFMISNVLRLPSENIDDTRHLLSNTEHDWLLVLDNADDPERNYERYFPSGTRGAILMTSRDPQCSYYNTVGSEDLGSLSSGDCITLLLRTAEFPAESRLEHEPAAKRVIDALGSHTLAVIQAGAYIGQGFCTLEHYPTEFQRQCEQLLKSSLGRAVSSRYLNVYATFEASAEVLESSTEEPHRDALNLLHLLALLHYDNIPLELFEDAWKGAKYARRTRDDEGASIDKLSEWHVSQLPQFIQVNLERWDPSRLLRAQNLLQSLALVSREKGCGSKMVSMHSLTHAWANVRQDQDRKGQSWRAAGCLITLSYYRNPTWRSDRTRLKLHLRSFLNVIDAESYEKKMESMPMEIIRNLFQCGQLLDELRVDSALQVLLDRLFGELDVDPTDPIEEFLPLYRLFSNNLQNIGKAEKAGQVLEKIENVEDGIVAKDHQYRPASQQTHHGLSRE